ncbi:MAG: adenylosuccinate lyase [Woeseia sp.]|jgi:adenylosuccinate lyase|nr:adenylosuccinate lyase [Woeseia sp.]
MEHNKLKALSPADGRYADQVNGLRDILSEFGLIRYRVLVEVRWLQWMADEASIPELPPLSAVMKEVLNNIVDNFTADDAERVKSIESKTNHDVKAVEYFIREKIGTCGETASLSEFIHFGCTSEDINNLAYALMLRAARDDVLQPSMRELSAKLRSMAADYADLPMLSRTHGQTATPTTVGKEIANVIERLARARRQLAAVEIRGKFNGAVGNFNAHLAAYPDADWLRIGNDFVTSLGLDPNTHTTQIEPHDWTAEYSQTLFRYNTILIDFCRDIWGYISIGYFTQNIAADEVGSSTMPHKVNPIDFENAEGNLGLANAILNHFATKLPISRWQRDLTDSTVQRNFGVALGYVIIAIHSTVKGLRKLQANPTVLAADLDSAWEVLAEPIQTVMRRYGIAEPYEKLKTLTRGQAVTQNLLQDFIRTLEIPAEEQARLLEMTPSNYIGLASTLAQKSS